MRVNTRNGEPEDIDVRKIPTPSLDGRRNPLGFVSNGTAGVNKVKTNPDTSVETKRRILLVPNGL